MAVPRQIITVPPHYVRHNESNRVPRRWVHFDTEAHLDKHVDVTTQSWRLGVTCFEHCDNDRREWTEPQWRTHDDPAELWAYIGSRAKKRSRTIVVAHNIGYDLRISGALSHLPAQGWEVDLFSIGGRSLTMTLSRDGAKLVLVDFMAWVPTSLEAIGAMVGLPKLDLPDELDTHDAWEARCVRDVEILRAANLDVVRWVDDADLGNWQRSGAGMANSVWRHRHMTHRVLVHADTDARAAESAAIHTGRCEVFRWGELPSGEWLEWDLPLAYPRVCLDTPLPYHLLSHVDRPLLSWYDTRSPAIRVLARATVTTNEPVLPVPTDDGFVWPVGTFTGWWWDNELDLACAFGESVELHECYVYKSAPVLAEWARWVVDVIETKDGSVSEVRRAAAKHMSRAFIGRMGAKFPVWTEYAECPADALSLSEFHDLDTGESGHLLELGGVSYLGVTEDYIPDANLAIMGAIFAECRVRLFQLRQAAGPAHTVYVDTDSLITDRTGSRRLRAWVRDGMGWGVRPKGRYRDVTLLGPRQLVVDGHSRVAGVPSKAKRIDVDKWEGEKWDGVQSTLASGQPDVVVVRDTVWKVNGVDRRRRHLEGGRTEAIRVGPDQGATPG